MYEATTVDANRCEAESAVGDFIRRVAHRDDVKEMVGQSPRFECSTSFEANDTSYFEISYINPNYGRHGRVDDDIFAESTKSFADAIERLLMGAREQSILNRMISEISAECDDDLSARLEEHEMADEVSEWIDEYGADLVDASASLTTKDASEGVHYLQVSMVDPAVAIEVKGHHTDELLRLLIDRTRENDVLDTYHAIITEAVAQLRSSEDGEYEDEDPEELSEFIDSADIGPMMDTSVVSTTSSTDDNGDPHSIEEIVPAPEIGSELDFETRMYYLGQDDTVEENTAQVMDYHSLDETVDIRLRLPDDSHGRVEYVIPDEKNGPLIEFLRAAHVDEGDRLEPIPLEEVHLLNDAVVPVERTGDAWSVATDVDVDYDSQIDVDDLDSSEWTSLPRRIMSGLFSLGLITFSIPGLLMVFVYVWMIFVSITKGKEDTVDMGRDLWNREGKWWLLVLLSVFAWIWIWVLIT